MGTSGLQEDLCTGSSVGPQLLSNPLCCDTCLCLRDGMLQLNHEYSVVSLLMSPEQDVDLHSTVSSSYCCSLMWPLFLSFLAYLPEHLLFHSNKCESKAIYWAANPRILFSHPRDLYTNIYKADTFQKHPSKQVLNSSKNPILHEFGWRWDRAVVVGKWCVLWAAQICLMPWSRNGCSVSDLLAKRILYFLNSHGDGLISIATGFSLLPFPLTGRNTLTSWKC